MSAPPPSSTDSDSPRKWLPWVIGVAVVLFLAWWVWGRAEAPEAAAMPDTTQTMMAPAPEPTPAAAPAPVETAAPVDTTPVKGTTASGPRIKASAATDTAVPAATPTPAPEGPGAMGGHGEPGKKPPAPTP